MTATIARPLFLFKQLFMFSSKLIILYFRGLQKFHLTPHEQRNRHILILIPFWLPIPTLGVVYIDYMILILIIFGLLIFIDCWGIFQFRIWITNLILRFIGNMQFVQQLIYLVVETVCALLFLFVIKVANSFLKFTLGRWTELLWHIKVVSGSTWNFFFYLSIFTFSGQRWMTVHRGKSLNALRPLLNLLRFLLYNIHKLGNTRLTLVTTITMIA